MQQVGRRLAVSVAFGVLVAGWLGAPASSEQAGSEVRALQAGVLDAGALHSCALLDDGTVRCWGRGIEGQLGYANTTTIGDDEGPGSVGPVDLGAGRTARAITAGGDHTCALLDNGTVRCWGSASNGQLGYANTTTIGDDEAPGSVGPVDVGAGRTARAITAGVSHSCVLLDDGTVRCWGRGTAGKAQKGLPPAPAGRRHRRRRQHRHHHQDHHRQTRQEEEAQEVSR